MDMNRRMLLRAAGAGLCLSAAPDAFAKSNWPSRTVTIISPYGVGGPNDLSARVFAAELGKRLGQSFIVENKTGAGTRVGNNYVAHARGDGYTLLYAAAPYATQEALYGNLGYNPRKDLQPVAMTATVPLFLIVNAKLGVKTAQELVAYGKANPKGLTFADPGYGSMPHLAEELLLQESGVKGLAVHHRGDVGAYTDLLAGRVDATLTALTAALPYVRNGKLRVLGVASDKRSAIDPTAPTLAEQGLPEVVAYGWYGFMAPAAVPQPIVSRLDAAILASLKEPQVSKRLLALGMDPHPLDAAGFRAFIDAQMSKWGAVIRKAGLKGGGGA